MKLIDLLLAKADRLRETLQQFESSSNQLSEQRPDHFDAEAQRAEEEAVQIGQLWVNVGQARQTFKQLCSRRGRPSEAHRNNLDTSRQQVQTAEEAFEHEFRILEQRVMISQLFNCLCTA